MKIAFSSNYLNHHQEEFSINLYKNDDVEYYFIANNPFNEKRLKLGYEDINKKYDFIIKVSDKEVITDLLGKFEEADPNDISITFDRIVGTYDKPYNEHAIKEHMADLEVFNSDGINALTKLSESVSNISNINNISVQPLYSLLPFLCSLSENSYSSAAISPQE